MLDFKEYLSNIDIDVREKNYVLSYFNKKEYIDKLNDSMINKYITKQDAPFQSSKGNYNSKIAIIIDEHTNIKEIHNTIRKALEKINTSLWNIYMTPLIKSIKVPDNDNTMFLKCEIDAISPSIVIFISDNVTSFKEDTFYNQLIGTNNKDDIKLVNINTEDLLTKYSKHIDEEFDIQINQLLLSLIPLREIEIQK